jgi:hypothetical protein
MFMQHISTPLDVISAVGGVVRLMDLTGVPRSTAATWQMRKKIPAKHWPVVVGAARDAGHDLTLERMFEIHAPQQEPAQ